MLLTCFAGNLVSLNVAIFEGVCSDFLCSQLSSFYANFLTVNNALGVKYSLSYMLLGAFQNIMDALKTVSSGRTSIFIAHRLTTIADADEIFVMDKGSVAEKGTHRQLLASPSSLYSELWHSQHASVKLN